MQIAYKSLASIKPYENNPRNNEGAIDYVANSIQEFGFKNPIVLDKNNVIVCGHTRYEAAKKLGLETVPCVMADDLTEEQVRAYRLVDNKTSEYSDWNMELLNFEMEALCDLDFDLEKFGFDIECDEIEEIAERKDLSDTLKENYELIIKCNNENELEKMYEELVERGFECRISTL